MFNKIFYKILLFNVFIIIAMTVMFFALSNHASKFMFSNALNGIDIEVMDIMKRVDGKLRVIDGASELLSRAPILGALGCQ